jgi:hypothetical protein
MNSYKILKSSKSKVGKLNKGIISYAKQNNTKIDLDDIKSIGKYIMDTIESKYNKKCKLVINGLGVLGRTTIKSYEDDINYIANNDDEYLNGRVREKTKFQEFTQIEIYYYY